MQYPLPERIGDPRLLVGRQQEFAYINNWLSLIPRLASRSIAMLARKKSGKTAIIQRMFNQLWNANGDIIPFFYEVKASNVWLPDLADDYFRRFASQYISFLERDPKLVQATWSLEAICAYGVKNDLPVLATNAKDMLACRERGQHHQMWTIAMEAPHNYAYVLDRRWVVLIDEFQNLAEHVYADADFRVKHDSLPGSYHEHSESKYAPMFVTGSYVGWLSRVVSQYLEAGRLRFYEISPYLEHDDGLEAVYRYADYYRVPIHPNCAEAINTLCQSDPFFISCVIQSHYPNRNFTKLERVRETVTFELTNRKVGFSRTWAEYIDGALDRINDTHARKILLFLSQNANQFWTHLEIKETLQLDLDPKDLLRKLNHLALSDLITQGVSDIEFKGLNDGTLFLVLTHRFKQEVAEFQIDQQADFRRQLEDVKRRNAQLQGKLNQISGKIAEDLLASELRTQKRIHLSDFFDGVPQDDTRWNLISVNSRHLQKRKDGKRFEIDVWAKSDDHQLLCVEVKKTEAAIGKTVVTNFMEKLKWIQEDHPDHTVVGAFLSLGGFTEEAQTLCTEHQIGTATRLKSIDRFFEEGSSFE